ncbi:DUF2752 domain-containing protein [Zavarzinella formosa]|uniref:DUF2752 domain-containing protein n=1 Tax=Zavarzinella formosa TaxID=360055 RepID=UPI0002EBE796|nr:DUF2752 domain-containing protein [Zavarzinella formosa]
MNVTSPPQNPRLSVRKGLLFGSLFLILAGGMVVITVFPPTETPWYPKCTFKEVTGYHCPGCGTARAIHSLCNGRILQAIVYNPFTVVAVCYLIAEPINAAIARWRRRPKFALTTWMVWTFVCLLMIFGVLRNIPSPPFTYLAPHEITPVVRED